MQKVIKNKYKNGTVIQIKKDKYVLKFLRKCITFLGEPEGYLYQLIKE